MQPLILTTLLIFFTNSRRHKSLILKNMQSHSIRNLKTSLMLTIAISYLLFCSSATSQLQYIAVSLTTAVVNADAALFVTSSGASLREAPLSIFLDEQISKGGSIVKGYNYLGWTANEALGGL